jgi:hypothetical protein
MSVEIYMKYVNVGNLRDRFTLRFNITKDDYDTKLFGDLKEKAINNLLETKGISVNSDDMDLILNGKPLNDQDRMNKYEDNFNIGISNLFPKLKLRKKLSSQPVGVAAEDPSVVTVDNPLAMGPAAAQRAQEPISQQQEPVAGPSAGASVEERVNFYEGLAPSDSSSQGGYLPKKKRSKRSKKMKRKSTNKRINKTRRKKTRRKKTRRKKTRRKKTKRRRR